MAYAGGGVDLDPRVCGQQLLEACLRLHLQVPEQIAVIGADNDELICNISQPPLSSVMINDEQRGYEAARMLDILMSGGTPPQNPVYVEPAGVISRASTDILAIDDPPLVEALRFVRERGCDGPRVVAERGECGDAGDPCGGEPRELHTGGSLRLRERAIVRDLRHAV